MARNFFVSITYIKDNTLLDNSINDKKLRVILQNAQDIYLQELLCKKLFDELLLASINSTLNDVQKTFSGHRLSQFELVVWKKSSYFQEEKVKTSMF